MVNKTDPRLFMITGSKSHAHIAAEMADKIKSIIYEDSGIPLALAVGVLRIIESEILSDNKE